MFNLVVLTGRLTADPELKTTQSGVSVVSFCVAVQRQYKSGEDPITDFINIVAWRHTAEFVTKYFHKGNMIGIEGSIQTRKYTDKDGNNRTAFEVLANNVQFVESKRNSADVNVATDSEDPLKQVSENLQNAGFDTANVSDDGDLPF
ncbi:MAG: single-stranded DNA-binding protein [Acutalibacteraceae bacterium]|nr:single-stranded DNA-binding protein [Acutalibacteraceae bacterium]